MNVVMKPDVSIIVVSYGAREMTLECLRSIARGIGDATCEIIVVDNNSSDGSPGAIEAGFPQVRLMAQSTNLGFAAACNLGAREARGEYLLLLNPDTVVLDEAIGRLLAFARDRPGAGIWGGRTVFGDGSLNPMSCWRRPTLWTLLCSGLAMDTRYPRSALFNAYGYGGWKRDSAREVDVVAGCFLLIQKALWDRLGGFDSAFFMYGEDVDLCLRARRLGFRPAIAPQATIVHHGSGTEEDKVRKIRQVLAARALLIRRHFPWTKRQTGLALLALRPMLGRLLAKRELRETWNEVWALRHQWMTGRF
jgi:GT2 family glycosyltransferase